MGEMELQPEVRHTPNANFKKLMEEINATYLGHPNPYDL